MKRQAGRVGVVVYTDERPKLLARRHARRSIGFKQIAKNMKASGRCQVGLAKLAYARKLNARRFIYGIHGHV